jgi:hypothetical protein
MVESWSWSLVGAPNKRPVGIENGWGKIFEKNVVRPVRVLKNWRHRAAPLNLLEWMTFG